MENQMIVAGADPELMLVDAEGILVSAIGKIPGTKESPHLVDCGAVQHDNVMAEFNVDPSSSSDEFEHNMREVLRQLQGIASPYSLIARASAEYPESALDSDDAKIFGCDPDFDSWSMSMNDVDGMAASKSFRSAGGHFHVGMVDSTREMLSDGFGKVEVVKMMDIFMGIPSILLDNDPTSHARRSLYGKAGAHRPKDYGVEYRALGNFWVRSPELVQLMYALAERAVSLTLDQESTKIIDGIGEDRIQSIINTSDAKGAKDALDKVIASYLDKDIYSQLLKLIPMKELEGHSLSTSWGL